MKNLKIDIENKKICNCSNKDSLIDLIKSNEYKKYDTITFSENTPLANDEIFQRIALLAIFVGFGFGMFIGVFTVLVIKLFI